MNKKHIRHAAVAALVLLLVGGLVFGLSKIKAYRSSDTPSTEITIDLGNRSSILKSYLTMSSEDPAAWFERGGKLIAKSGEQEFDSENKPILLTHSVALVASSKHENKNAGRYAFLIENSYRQEDADYPEHDHYACEVLVLARKGDAWSMENLDPAEEYRYEGGTRFAKNCAGFKIRWKDGFPVFSRTETFGPYAGGEFVTVKEVIVRKAGKYQMQAPAQ